ncbi:hypothetical protein HPB49_003905 [Dermacentor silvarum]|uniref:Uncharacterized protein n=1 Tax=Dermacentor silvarum TaxID=543639 RepID=A0ACB8C790_DERSI|nr:hypothetical protein HPB49_003905 [Dermacentor silvarum]
MAPPCNKREFLSLEDKGRILAEVASRQKKGDVAEKFGISPSSLSAILNPKEAIEKAFASGTSAKRKKLTPSVHEEFNKAVYTWFVETRAKKIPLPRCRLRCPADCNEAVHSPAEAIASWTDLQDAGIVPSSVKLKDFFSADIDVIGHEELSNEDVIKVSATTGSQMKTEVPDLQPPLATARVLDAFDVAM